MMLQVCRDLHMKTYTEDCDIDYIREYQRKARMILGSLHESQDE